MSDIEAVIHDVNASCSNLRSAVALLRDGKSQLIPELIEILEIEHEKLGRAIVQFKIRRINSITYK